MKETCAVILAAGLGTRMKSDLAKGLHRAAGMPLIWYPVQAAFDAGVDRVVIVVGHQRENIRAEVERLFPGRRIDFVVQEQQLGTAHATMCARGSVTGCDRAVFINGDLPLLTGETISRVIDAFDSSGGIFALLTAVVPQPGGFGRIIRDRAGVASILEARDATPEQLAISEVNVGVYVAEPVQMFERLSRIGTANATGEFYFTDIVSDLRASGHMVGAWVLPDADEARQVNDRVELAAAEERLHARRIRELRLAGVTVHQGESVVVDRDCDVGRDTEIHAGCEITSGSRIGKRCVVGRGCVIQNTTVGDDVTIKPYSIFIDSQVDDGCVMGPFCHLRPASRAMKGAHVGNFVELKKTVLGTGSKANHLTYLGDCTIGSGANIGAGTITCNYDGFSKMPTEIGDGAFIGSDTQLVAPVKVGAGAYVAAGTTVTKDVPAGALAISRVEQKHVDGYAARKRAKAGK